jgi:hypothetical protein
MSLPAIREWVVFWDGGLTCQLTDGGLSEPFELSFGAPGPPFCAAHSSALLHLPTREAPSKRHKTVVLPAPQNHSIGLPDSSRRAMTPHPKSTITVAAAQAKMDSYHRGRPFRRRTTALPPSPNDSTYRDASEKPPRDVSFSTPTRIAIPQLRRPMISSTNPNKLP